MMYAPDNASFQDSVCRDSRFRSVKHNMEVPRRKLGVSRKVLWGLGVGSGLTKRRRSLHEKIERGRFYGLVKKA